MGQKIEYFTDLNAWKEGHKLVLMVYEIVRTFPSKEQFILTSQIVRAVISITCNIAEGFGRRTIKEKIQFYSTSQGSLREVQNQLIIAKDVGYIEKDTFDELWEQTIIVHKLISGLIKSLRKI
jgi:four helix bundle protein